MKKIVNPWKGLDGYFCFGCSPDNEAGLKMEFYADGDEVVSFWQPQARYQGWLNTLHGGIQATLLDEICAWAIVWKLQTTGVTSKMETRYLKPIATDGGPLTLRAAITEQRRNLAIVTASITNSAGEVCTRAVCTYFTFPKEKARTDMFFNGCTIEAADTADAVTVSE